MIRPTFEQVIRTYEILVHAGHLSRPGELEGAVAAPFQDVFGHMPYPTLLQQAAKLTSGISRAQAYTDGNKRLAWLTTVQFLEINGLVLDEIDAADVEHFVLTIDHGEEGLISAARWLSERVRTST